MVLVDAFSRPVGWQVVRSPTLASASIIGEPFTHLQLEAVASSSAAGRRVVVGTNAGMALTNEAQLLVESPLRRKRHPSENCAFEVVATSTIRTIRAPVADEEVSADVKVFTGRSSLAWALLKLHTETCKSKHVHLHAMHRIKVIIEIVIIQASLSIRWKENQF